MDETKVVQCKRITVDRFLLATLYSIGAQVAPVTIFLLFVNFNLFHPITWILDTCRLVFSVYTWIYMVPLIVFVCTHAIVWSKVFLSQTSYYPNRFMLILNTCTKKSALLITHTMVGFFTAWVFIKILNWKAGVLSAEATWSLLLAGMFMGAYHFVKSRLRLIRDVHFPLIQQTRFLRIRAHLYSILQRSFFTALMPSFIYVSLAVVLMPLTVAQFDVQHFSVATLFRNWKLLVYIWILASQILANMQFMEHLFMVFLTEAHQFPVQANGTDALTLADALKADHFKIIQELASLDLYTMAEGRNGGRRKELFSLSIPGGHPYNWKAVSEATMRNISTFTAELVAAIENVQSYEKNQSQQQQSPTGGLGVTPAHMKIRNATQMAEKIMQRQMNENLGIRNMSHIYPGGGAEDAMAVDKRPKILQRLPPPQDVQNGVENCLRTTKAKLMALPGISYFLAEQHYARVYFVLRQSQRIVWLLQGISALATHSLREDEYGIVQKTLPAIVAQLLELKTVADQVETISMDRSKFRGHQKALRSAVKRSLYSIASSFGNYLPDLILPDSDRDALLSYVYYREN